MRRWLNVIQIVLLIMALTMQRNRLPDKLCVYARPMLLYMHLRCAGASELEATKIVCNIIQPKMLGNEIVADSLLCTCHASREEEMDDGITVA